MSLWEKNWWFLFWILILSPLREHRAGEKNMREVTENAAFVSDSQGVLSCFESKARQHGFSSHFMTWQNIMLLKNMFLLSFFTPGSDPREKRMELFCWPRPGSQKTRAKMRKVKSGKEVIPCTIPSNSMTLSGFNTLQWLQAAGPLDITRLQVHAQWFQVLDLSQQLSAPAFQIPVTIHGMSYSSVPQAVSHVSGHPSCYGWLLFQARCKKKLMSC